MVHVYQFILEEESGDQQLTLANTDNDIPNDTVLSSNLKTHAFVWGSFSCHKVRILPLYWRCLSCCVLKINIFLCKFTKSESHLYIFDFRLQNMNCFFTQLNINYYRPSIQRVELAVLVPFYGGGGWGTYCGWMVHHGIHAPDRVHVHHIRASGR